MEEFDKLESELDRIKEGYPEAVAENQRLSRENQELTERNQKLIDENQRLVDENQRFRELLTRSLKTIRETNDAVDGLNDRDT